jgi:hypothetical protein
MYHDRVVGAGLLLHSKMITSVYLPQNGLCWTLVKQQGIGSGQWLKERDGQ